MSDAVDTALQKQLLWKSERLLPIAVAIVRHLSKETRAFADEVDLQFVADDDKSLIGQSWRVLANNRLLQKTGSFHRSHKPESQGRTVFEYTVANVALCDAFLKKFGAAKDARQADLDLFTKN